MLLIFHLVQTMFLNIDKTQVIIFFSAHAHTQIHVYVLIEPLYPNYYSYFFFRESIYIYSNNQIAIQRVRIDRGTNSTHVPY